MLIKAPFNREDELTEWLPWQRRESKGPECPALKTGNVAVGILVG